MNIPNLEGLLESGLALWVLAGGGLVCLVLDALLGKKGTPVVYGTGIATLVYSLVTVFKQWASGTFSQTSLLLFDATTFFFVLIILLVGILSLFNAFSYFKMAAYESSELLNRATVSLVLFSLVGMIFLFASDHLMVNFIGLETMSIAIYILVGSNIHDVRSQEASIKYFVLGSVASAILLLGIALLYGVSQSFELSAMHTALGVAENAGLAKVGLVMLLVGAFFKLSIAPFHFWTPDVYEGAPSPITGFMASGVKVAGFAFLIRILIHIKTLPSESVLTLIELGVVATLIVGNFGALRQDNLKRMLAYSSIAHAGYLMLGLLAGYKGGTFDPQVTSALFFYLLSYSLMTLGAFAVLSVLLKNTQEASQFKDIQGLGYSHPVLAALLSLFLISFLGIPPTVGFIAKYGLFSYAIKNGYAELGIFAIVTSVVSAYYYLRPLVEMYFKGRPETPTQVLVPFPLTITLALCGLCVVYLGVNPQDYLHMASLAASLLK